LNEPKPCPNMYRLSSLAAVVLSGTAVLAQPVFTDASANLSHNASSGACVGIADMDGDGLDDIVQLDMSQHVYILYQNPDHSFVTYDYGVVENNDSEWGWAMADLNNDGHKDICSGVSTTRFLSISARGVYTLTNLDGPTIFTQCMTMADFDNDGRVDVFACNDVGPSNIWITNASGTPVYDPNVMPWATTCTGTSGDMSGNYGSTCTDFDNDGDIDLSISHCRQGVNDPNDCRRWDRLFVNDGSNNYADLAADYGMQNHEQVWTTDFGDVDNDGDLDAFSTTHSSTLMLFMNDGTGHFTNATAGSGLENTTGFFLQAKMEDMDNDGFLDILTGSAQHFFLGKGDGTFTEVANAFPAAKSILSFAFGDLNGDGFQDVYAGYGDGYVDGDPGFPDRLWLNTPNGNHFLNVKLEGTVSNRDAVGARVTITGPWGTMIREVHAGESYGITNSFVCHFGLGANTEVTSMLIHWPSGQEDTYSNIAANQTLTYVEGGCASPNVVINSGGDAVLCPGDPAITLNADMGSGFIYTWSTGANTPSIDVSAGGSYSVVLADGSECPGQATVNVIENPDQTPTVTVTGGTAVCETDGAILTSSDADAYVWSNELTSQSITVTTSGTYSVTIQGYCQDWTSEPVTIEVADAPDAPAANGASIAYGATANLSATGTNIAWYDVATGGTALATGNDWTTPSLFATTSFWCADQNLSGGEIFYGGRTDQTTTGEDSNSGYYLLFDANEDMVIKSVKVYANGAGVRDIEVRDESNGTTVASGSFDVPDGESRIDLNFSVPAGGPYGLRPTSDQPEMWRDGLGSNPEYPYDLGGLGSITGTTVQGGNSNAYYYFFYDWEVQRALNVCESARTEVLVEVAPQGINDGSVSGFAVYPVPTSAMLTIDFGTIAGEVDMDLVDVTGRVVNAEHRTVKGNGTLDVSDLARGEYTLRVRHANGLIVRRVVVR
jgi:hypothetical protein